MSRRRRTAAAFSLFSFQDIITAVTAILILLVLILALELIAQLQQAAATDQTVSRDSLADSAATLESLVERLSSVVAEDGVRPLVRRTPGELERDIRVLEDEARQAAAEAQEARVIESRARTLAAAALARLDNAREIREEVDRTKEEAALAEQEARKITLDNEREAERQAAKQKEIAERPSPGAELVFNAPKEFNVQAWIVEVSSEGLAAVKLGANQRMALGSGMGSGSAAASWLSSLRSGRDHVLILVRPSGVGSVEGIRDGLREAKISFGIDFIGEDQIVRDGLGEANSGRAAHDES